LIAGIIVVGGARAVAIGQRTLEKIGVGVRTCGRADRFWSSSSSLSETRFLS
jgi:hypothetical protein